MDNNQPLNETETRHWNSMKDSQYINYSFKDFADKTKRMSSPTVVAEWFTNTFERPLAKDKKYTQRGYYAEQIYNMFNPYNNFL